MKLFPYIKMYGNARPALERYKNIFNGVITRLNEYKNSPLANQKNANLIIHSELHFAGNIICMADMITKEEGESMKAKASDQIYELCINFDSDKLSDAVRIFKELSQDGEVLMKFEKTFWGACYGKVKDMYGIVWSLNCPIENEKGNPQGQQCQQKEKEGCHQKQ